MACDICDRVAAGAHDAVVYDDGTFVAYQVAEVPGWITLATRAHVDGPQHLDDAEADGLGRLIRAVASAVVAATGAERTHVVYLGEHSRHFHAGFFPRSAGEGPLLGNEPLVAALGAGADPGRAATVRAAVRELLAA